MLPADQHIARSVELLGLFSGLVGVVAVDVCVERDAQVGGEWGDGVTRAVARAVWSRNEMGLVEGVGGMEG